MAAIICSLTPNDLYIFAEPIVGWSQGQREIMSWKTAYYWSTVQCNK